MTKHRIKDDTRLHAHHGNKPAIIKFFAVHLQIGKHIYCRLKEKGLRQCRVLPQIRDRQPSLLQCL